MGFHIRGLSPDTFAPLFQLTDEELARRSILRYRANGEGKLPCRISLADAEPGDHVLLVNYEHQPATASPYRACGPIFVRAQATDAYDGVDDVPPMLGSRLLSVRGYDCNDLIVAADVTDGAALKPLIARLFDQADVAYLHVHFAKHGCFAARIDRI